ncbi:RNA polymerase ADP-ribosylase [Escherichia phage AnYang]|uniref:NAD(+)--arginine ADP-ribosyltransferase n=1 Tax=Escherichia phage AnYang TaxID=2499909 RepID=A0A410T550_9CAUD|nr:Alt-like RNA polymerase ADP-ribosyltransferase [Escherichia phage AnYang]QAU03759.1 RNA polymerase ADP-ribosylase [Escherichia phage AnYang]
MTEQLNEVFESEGTLPTVNLNPKLKVPQIWKIGDAESQLVARMVSYASEGDAIKQVKLGDKYAHVILMSLSAKGTPAELKGGLGPTPIDAINTIFDAVFEQVKKLRMDAVMFRFPTKKMKGQGPIVQRIIQRLVTQKTGGRFKVIPAMYQFTGKHTYILVVRKQADIEDIKGMPGINAELYTKVDSDVGEVYISKKEGVQVTKETAIAGSIAKVEERRTDKMVITKTKISRRAIAASQSLESYRNESELFKKYEANAVDFNKPATAPLIPEAQEMVTNNNSPAAKNKVANIVAEGTAEELHYDYKMFPLHGIGEIKEKIKEKILSAIKNEPLTSVKALEKYASAINTVFEEYKGEWLATHNKTRKGQPDDLWNELTESKWKASKTKFIKKRVYSFAGVGGGSMIDITIAREGSKYTPSQKRGIREYCGSGYGDINNLLLGRYNPQNYEIMSEKDIESAVNNLDSAFENGDRIPEGITVYRAQSMTAPIYEALVKNKVFYFRNFVSTSLTPIIFGRFGVTHAGIGLLEPEVRNELTVDKNEEGITINPNEIRAYKENPDYVKVQIGWAIDGAHKVNVVYPGNLGIATEAEVILPRGLMVKVNKITDASNNDGRTSNNTKLIQAEVMTTDELQESVVYDGDVLMETGELVVYQDDFDTSESPVSFDSFVKSTRVDVLSLLASCIDLYDIPEKFIQG